jgi:two-component system sensor histidine kinase KdpD
LHTVPLEELIRAALTRAATITRRHHVRITLEPNLPSLAVDPAAIVEVLYILLDNGSKYAPEGTDIHLVASRQDEHFVRVAVIDEGPGIPPPLRERVFDKFFRIQGREPIDPSRVGVGLGLPIARRLVEAQSGRIWIESNPSSKGGTAVMMTLPLNAEVPASDVIEESRTWRPAPQTDHASSS